ncbi:unnamed protein product [Amoebophrya sp. A25]|nr:unnamed protein product [Amoebophrya sp. A25]|eukprot:GSA25T00023301001.1
MGGTAHSIPLDTLWHQGASKGATGSTTQSARSKRSTTTSFLLEKVPITSLNCVKDYHQQLCPFAWFVGPDGDTCRAPDGYTGPCHSILHGMSQLSMEDKHRLEKDCEAPWACRGLYDAEGPYLDPSLLTGKADALLKRRLQMFLKPAEQCFYRRLKNQWLYRVMAEEGKTLTYESFPKLINEAGCQVQCALRPRSECAFYSYLPLNFPEPLRGRCVMLSQDVVRRLGQKQVVGQTPHHLIKFDRLDLGPKEGVNSGFRGECINLNAAPFDSLQLPGTAKLQTPKGHRHKDNSTDVVDNDRPPRPIKFSTTGSAADFLFGAGSVGRNGPLISGSGPHGIVVNPKVSNWLKLSPFPSVAVA